MRELAWVVLAAVAALGAAGVAVFASLGLSAMDTVVATTLRAVIMAALLLAVVIATGRLRMMLGVGGEASWRTWAFIVLAGVCGAVSWLAYFGALKLGPAGPVAAIDRLSVALVFLCGVLVLGERYSWRGWAGLVLVVIGVSLVATEKQTKPMKPSAPATTTQAQNEP